MFVSFFSNNTISAFIFLSILLFLFFYLFLQILLFSFLNIYKIIINLNNYKIKIKEKLKIKYIKIYEEISIQRKWNKIFYRHFDVSKYYGQNKCKP